MELFCCYLARWYAEYRRAIPAYQFIGAQELVTREHVRQEGCTSDYRFWNRIAYFLIELPNDSFHGAVLSLNYAHLIMTTCWLWVE